MPAITPAWQETAPEVEDAYPLSPLQQGMWFDSLHAPRSAVNVEQLLGRLREVVDLEAFRAAWRRVVDRHPLLRTRFVARDGEPRQEVLRRVRVPWQTLDWRGLSSRERRRLRDAFLREDRRRGFDMTAAPLFRLTLVREKDDRSWFCWTSHHLIGDGRSVLMVLKELFGLYEAFQRGEDLDLPAVPPFRGYIEWLRRQDWERSESFWRERFEDYHGPTPLPAARATARELPPEECVGEHEDRLSPEATARLKAWGEANRLTPNTLFQGAWALLVSRYTGEKDVVFGAIRACRRSTVAGTDRVAGPCINNVPIRVRVEASQALVPWLHELQAQWIALRKHEHTPLFKVQAWSGVPRGTPLFETVVNFQDPSWDDALRAQGGRWERRDFSVRCQPGVPLAVDGYAGPALRLKVTYDRRRFDADAVAGMTGHLRTVLEALPFHGDKTVGALPLLPAEERRQILTRWNDTEREYPRHLRVHELFEAQARRTPRATALVFGPERLTYQELNREANRLAHSLRDRGVRRGDLVALCAERSPAMIVGMLAVLKAGGAYVPLDPDYPAERLAFMLEDAQAPFLLTQSRLGGRLPNTRTEVVSLDEPSAFGTDTTDPRVEGGAGDAAIVLYTSGSTGVPKGVALPHRGVSRLVINTDYIRLGHRDRVAQVSNASFDAATFEVWGALLNGACLVGVGRDDLLSPRALDGQIKTHGITVILLTTALFNRLTLEMPGLLRPLRVVLFGGEQADPRRVREVLRQGPPGRLLHVYGPTETTTLATWHHVREVGETDVTVPIGRPIANTTAYVLDERGEPVPLGARGELYVGGDGVALGYVNRPDLTAERFLSDPFHPEPGLRMYRTGDVVRQSPDGSLEFLGRTDNQVKVRGFRVEPGEVEAVLAGHPDVREAVVVAREDEPGCRRLVAYVTPRPGAAGPVHQPRAFLRSRLPEYMVPSAVVELPRLPLTPGGKVDRGALPKPGRSAEVPAAGPGGLTTAEELIAGVWADVLHLEQAGVNDHFFEQGGDSLLAMQAVSRLNKAFGVEMSVRAVFDNPTVAAMNAHIAACRERADGALYPEIVPVPRGAPLPASVEQERMWRGCLRGGPESFGFVWPMRFRLTGPLDAVALERSLNELVRRHELLRTTFRMTEGGLVQVIDPPEPVTLPVVNLEGTADAPGEWRRLAEEEMRHPVDLTTGPLVRARLVRLGAAEHRLLLTLHHIVYDPRGLELLGRELSALYEAFLGGEAVRAVEPTLQYADYAAWQRRWLREQGTAFDTQMAYWTGKLADLPAPVDEPFRRPAPAAGGKMSGRFRRMLPTGLLDRLRALSRREGVTLFMTGLAALKAAVCQITRQEDVLVVTRSGKRSRPGTDGLVGYLGNHLFLRTDLSGDPTFAELLGRVRQTLLEAAAHDELPYEVLADAFRKAGRRLPPTRFRYAGVPGVDFDLVLAGLKTSRIPVKPKALPSGLNLVISDRPKRARLGVTFDPSGYDPDALRALLARWAGVMERVADAPGRRISEC